MRTVIEEGVDALVARFKGHAADVEFTARVEGSPLLECLAGDVVLQLFERTGPYLARTGRGRVIVQAEAARCDRVAADDPGPRRSLEVTSVSGVKASGVVVRRDPPFLVVDAGVPLVVAFDALPDDVAVGDRVGFDSRAPVHGFVLPTTSSRVAVATDDLV